MTKEEIIKIADDIQGWMNLEELEGLYKLSHVNLKKGDLVVEVGSWKGRSSFVLASVCKEKGATLICIDNFTGAEMCEVDRRDAGILGVNDFFNTYIKKNLEGLPVKYIIKNSLEAHRLIKNSSLALCFIDGDHRAPVIGQDIENYWPKVKEGGIFCGHDYNAGWPDVARAVNWNFPDIDKITLYGSIWSVRK